MPVLTVFVLGGQLAVRHEHDELVFDWSSPLAPPDHGPKNIQWAAFYSDCEYEVYEVTSGHRLTLTYNLYITRGAGNLAGHADTILDPTHLPLYDTLKAAFDTPGFFNQGRVLGVNLVHAYAHTTPTYHFLPTSLKGSDMVLYEVARSLGLACYV